MPDSGWELWAVGGLMGVLCASATLIGVFDVAVKNVGPRLGPCLALQESSPGTVLFGTPFAIPLRCVRAIKISMPLSDRKLSGISNACNISPRRQTNTGWFQESNPASLCFVVNSTWIQPVS